MLSRQELLWWALLWWRSKAAILSENISFCFSDSFTAMVWATTTHMGCARAFSGSQAFLYCNYGPAGNQDGESVYLRGEPCTLCPNESPCHVAYTGLCTSIDDLLYDVIVSIGNRMRLSLIYYFVSVIYFYIYLVLLNISNIRRKKSRRLPARGGYT